VFGLIEMGAFLAILLAAYAYVWRKGALEWAE
jgi:NADH:ubiquinone oxidoreductase subunit 3 (subunit A)